MSLSIQLAVDRAENLLLLLRPLSLYTLLPYLTTLPYCVSYHPFLIMFTVFFTPKIMKILQCQSTMLSLPSDLWWPSLGAPGSFRKVSYSVQSAVIIKHLLCASARHGDAVMNWKCFDIKEHQSHCF